MQGREQLPPELAAALARAAHRLGALGCEVHWHAETSSTNDLAARLAAQGAREGTVVIADTQTAGRGRHGRVWCSPPGAGLYASVVLRPDARTAALITIAAGVALAEGIRAATGLSPALKWPNDLYVGRRKLAGILAEASSSPSAGDEALSTGGAALSTGGAALQGCVLGFGINIRQVAYPADVAARATCLETELGRAADREALLAECLAALAARYDDLRSGRSSSVLDAWRAHARPLLGRRVEWSASGRELTGIADDVDETGALVVRTPEGTVRVISGEVRWI